MERGCAYGLQDQARVVLAICLLYNVVRTCESNEFTIGPTIPARADLLAGRTFRQEDLSMLDPDDADGNDAMGAIGLLGAANPRIARDRERRELEASQMRRAEAMWEAARGSQAL